MPVNTEFNVFSGEDALRDFYDPDKARPVPLVELPSRLNPYRADGVRIYAKLMSQLPATNVKSLPALNMILRAQEDGEITPDTHTIIEYSSGSTVISLGIISRIFGISNVKAYLSNKTTEVKLQLLRFFGLELTLFGGPSQPQQFDPNGGIHAAYLDGRAEGIYNPDQYTNIENYQAHMRWTGPQIYRQLPNISVLSASMGTAGTMTGTSLYLKSVKPSFIGLGVLTAPYERVPGPRTLNLLLPVEFPWRDAVDHYEEVGAFPSFEKSLELCRNGLLVGPSSGLALVGLLNFIQKQKENNALDSMRDENGDISCVFICCDQPFQYIADYFTKLGPSYFAPVNNEELHKVDLYPYNLDWDLSPTQADEMLSSASDFKLVILDLRNADDFKASHIDQSLNLDVDTRSRPNPYRDTATLVELFKLLEGRLAATDPTFGPALEGRTVITLSYHGHVAKLAMSILRNRGVKAHAVVGGLEAWKKGGLWENALKQTA